jgi:riboflavin synthase
MIVPYTWAHTTLAERAVGDRVNLEVDMLARYVARQLEGPTPDGRR